MTDESLPQNSASWGTVLGVAALFSGFCLLHVAIPGVNEPHYLCKARSAWEPGWCANDFFLQSPAAHAVFFSVVGWFTQYFSLATIAVVGRVLSSFVLAWGWSALAVCLGLRGVGTLMASALFCAISLTGNFSGEWVLGGFESKVPAWGLSFAAIASWLRTAQAPSLRSAAMTGLYAGLATTAHPVVGGWIVIGICMAEWSSLVPVIRRWRAAAGEDQVESPVVLARRWAVMMIVAGLAALPGLIPALRMITSSPLSPWEQGMANRIQVFLRLKHHLDPATFSPQAWIHTAVLLFLAGASCRYLIGTTASVRLRQYVQLLVAAIVIAVVGIVVGAHRGDVLPLYHWSSRAFLLKFYPFRLLDVLLPVTVSLVLSQLLMLKLKSLSVFRPSRVVAVILLLLVVAAFATRRNTPTGYTREEFAAWKQACAWIRLHTADDSLFVTPREAVGFKWFAERAEYVCYKDCPQNAAGILEWRRRLKTVSWIRPYELDGDLKPADLDRLQRDTAMTHLLTRHLHVVGQSPIYQNRTWRIYVARADANEQDSGEPTTAAEASAAQ